MMEALGGFLGGFCMRSIYSGVVTLDFMKKITKINESAISLLNRKHVLHTVLEIWCGNVGLYRI